VTQEELWMQKALKQAHVAAKRGEVPVGAVIIKDGKILARAHNTRETSHDPTAHAEILALQRAAKKLGGWRLSGCTLVVTMEPCPMCAGAAINARIERIVFGAYDEKAGCCGTVLDLTTQEKFNHRCEVTGGVMEGECRAVLRDFFVQRRKKKGQEKQ
jgi:tRNA(adenine34) deaminase